MDRILLLTGNVKYNITIDPGVWIFDERRIDLKTYFDEQHSETDELEEYTKSVAKFWDKEVMEGAALPETEKQQKMYEKEKLLTGTFGMQLNPFLMNAHPNEDAKKLIIHCSDRDVEVPLERAYKLIFGFSENGKPYLEDGPVRIFYGDGSNRENPIKNVISLRVI